jgi:hypothetical protein
VSEMAGRCNQGSCRCSGYHQSVFLVAHSLAVLRSGDSRCCCLHLLRVPKGLLGREWGGVSMRTALYDVY